MAIDFSQVKTITIPEGSVTKITDSTGAVLWQVESGNWHTIWEGSKTCSVTKSGTNDPVISGEELNLAQTVAGTGYKPKIRITFSHSNTNTDYDKWFDRFLVNAKYQDNASSPVTIEAVLDNDLNQNVYLCSAICFSFDSRASLSVGLSKERDTENNRIIITLKVIQRGNINSYPGNFTMTFTVTKIEQYY